METDAVYYLLPAFALGGAVLGFLLGASAVWVSLWFGVRRATRGE